jgi:hypothetical protein
MNYAVAIRLEWGTYSNTLEGVTLRIKTWRGATPYEPHGHHGKLEKVGELKLLPDFALDGSVLWLGRIGHAESHSTQELPERVLRWFIDRIAEHDQRLAARRR